MSNKLGNIIKEIINFDDESAFQDAKRFNSLFDDFGFELIEERKIFHRGLNDTILQNLYWVFSANNISRGDELKRVQYMMRSEYGLSESWTDTIIAGFADAFDMLEIYKNTIELQTTSAGNDVILELNSNNDDELEPLFKRVNIFLEDGDFKSANDYCEKILDINPESPMAYIGKLLAELHLPNTEQLGECAVILNDNGNYKKAVKYANDNLKRQLTNYAIAAEKRVTLNKKTQVYNNALELMNKNDYNSLSEAIQLFNTILDFKDVEDKVSEAKNRAEIIRKESIYKKAISMIKETEKSNREAAEMLQGISGYKDSDIIFDKCKKNAENYKIAYTRIASLQEITGKQKELENKYNSLGFFSGKEKNRISAEIEELKLEQQRIIDGLNELDINYNRAAIAYRLSTCERGSIFTYGKYKRPITWLTLCRDGDRILAITYNCLERIPFSSGNATWDKCSLRNWLNNSFYNSAFNQDEKENILSVKLHTPPTKENKRIISGGEDTIDKIFCLSVDEVKKYMPNISDRRADDLRYSERGITYTTLGWWTRSPGVSAEYGADVRSHRCTVDPGKIGYCIEKTSNFSAVRPAMWINIEM